MSLQLFGGGWQRAAKPHVCWLCGETIPRGEGYFKTTGIAHGRIFSVKHCRQTCETAGDMLDQNHHLAASVFSPTFKDWAHK